MVMRAHVTAAGDSFAVMAGGLTRFNAAADTPDVSMQSGGGSKDTWVLAAGSVNQLSLLPSPAQPLELSRAGGELPSRVADNFFWLGRYTERAEGLTRLLRGSRDAKRGRGRSSAVEPAMMISVPSYSETMVFTSAPRPC
jgi:hypothetical protein